MPDRTLKDKLRALADAVAQRLRRTVRPLDEDDAAALVEVAKVAAHMAVEKSATTEELVALADAIDHLILARRNTP